MFTVKEEHAWQRLHYDVTAGAYMHLDDPRPLELSSLSMLLPGPVAELVTAFLTLLCYL